MPPRFADTNIFLRYLTRDDEAKAERALRLLERVERGEERIVTTQMVIFETVFTLQRSYSMPKAEIRDVLDDLLSLSALHVNGKHLLRKALELYASANVSFVDAYNTTHMTAGGIDEIYTWDTDVDHLPGVVRIEP